MDQKTSGFYLEMAHNPYSILGTMARMREDMRRAASARKWKRGIGWALMGGGGLIVAGSCCLLNGSTAPLGVVAWVLAAVAIAAGVVMLSIAGPPVAIEHLDETYRLLYALKDDIGPDGQVIGWLDLTGPRQKHKEERRARSRSGKVKIYYRDPWLRIRFKLVDGNLIRLSIEDRVKTKAGGIAQYRTKLSAKLVVNPERYQIGATPRELPLPGAEVRRTDRDLVLSAEFFGRRKPPALPIDKVLETLKVMYNTLRSPFPAGAQT